MTDRYLQQGSFSFSEAGAYWLPHAAPLRIPLIFLQLPIPFLFLLLLLFILFLFRLDQFPVAAPGIANQAELEPRGGGGEGGEGANVDPQGAVPPLNLVHGRCQVPVVLKSNIKNFCSVQCCRSESKPDPDPQDPYVFEPP
jgi:hypothetical protein